MSDVRLKIILQYVTNNNMYLYMYENHDLDKFDQELTCTYGYIASSVPTLLYIEWQTKAELTPN